MSVLPVEPGLSSGVGPVAPRPRASPAAAGDGVRAPCVLLSWGDVQLSPPRGSKNNDDNKMCNN